MKPARPFILLGVLSLLALAPLAAAQEQVDVISLKHRPAAELVPVLKPLLDAGGVLSAKDNQLIVRSNLRNLAQLRELAEQLDRPLRRLLIEVRQPLADSREAARSDASGQISLPDQGAGVTVESHRSAGRDQAVGAQTLQVLEGRSAVISSGRWVPMAKRQVRDGEAETVIEHQEVSSGFSVTPRLSGNDAVLLEIAPFAASLDSGGGGVINRQQAVTTVSGPLGEWIEVGGTTRREADATRIYSTHERNEQQRRILIKVTILD